MMRSDHGTRIAKLVETLAPPIHYAIKVWMVNFHAHLGEKDVLLDVRKKGDMEDLLRLSIPSNHCGSHHQISV